MINKMQNSEYITGLDGLRAFAVIAVVAYHLSFSWARGGFLGVDIFFVISGYLITSKIINSQEKDRSFNFKEFWRGRARRLMPAAYAMIITIFVWAAVFNRKLLTKLMGDITASFFHVTNWWFIFHKQSYFDSFASPSPLKNLWSLAIEQQFYFLWPIVIVGGFKLIKDKSKLANMIFIGALCSAAFMGVLYKPGHDPSRIYFGTDTRAFELLIGSWLAMVYPLKRNYRNNFYSKGASLNKKLVLNITSTLCLAIFSFSIIFVNEFNAFLYRGGMFLISLNAALLIACVSHPGSYLSRLFSWKPLLWLGRRSYGIYLWHYPVIVLSTPAYEAGNPSYLRVVIQVAATLVIANFSYNYIEKPFRKYGLKEGIKKVRLGNKFKCKNFISAERFPVIVLILVFLIVTATMTSVLKGKQQIEKAEAEPTETICEEEKLSEDRGESANSVSDTAPYKELLAIGDSIMLDISSALKNKYSSITIDGKVGRQVYQALQLVPSYSKFNAPDKAVIIELGTNAYFTNQQIDDLLNAFSKAHIYLVNVRVPRQWESNVNKALEKKAKEYENVTLIDWYSEAINHPEYFAEDSVHLKPKGIIALTELIDKAIKNNKPIS